MNEFAALFETLDASTSTAAKVQALREYFARATPQDAAWAVYFLSGGKPRQTVPSGTLGELARELAQLPPWLFEESYLAVGDLAETIAHVLPQPEHTSNVSLASWIEERLLPLRGLDPQDQAARVAAYWSELDATGRFLLNKLIGGGFRVGVSKLLVQRALAEHAGIDAKLVAQRMMGYADKTAMPSAQAFERLISTETMPLLDAGQPYPFFLAHPADMPADEFERRLGPTTDWLVEWKFDGIRAQLVRRACQTWIWSRGEELVTDRFPEIVQAAQDVPEGTVLDGEIVVYLNDRPAPFALLQQRIGRKNITKKILADAPVVFIAYDLLEWAGEDLRTRPLAERRALLQAVAPACALQVSPEVQADHWPGLAQLRAQSRERGVEGLMLKHRLSHYGAGRRKQADLQAGTWWKWKIDPLSVDAVLIYAQAGHGRRASVYTDYTFAVWNRPPVDAGEAAAVIEAIANRKPAEPSALQLVPFAKAYSGLTDEEFRRIDAIVRKTTLEKFGPVRSLRPTLVFEIGFEGINRSTRHKSGIAVRFPRMLRIRDDKPLHEADALQTLEALLGAGDSTVA